MSLCDLKGISNYKILRDYAQLRASGINVVKGSPPGGNAGDEDKNRCESSQFWGSEKLMAGFCICLPGCVLTPCPCLALKNMGFFHCLECPH